MNCDGLVAVDQAPGLRALQEGLVGDKVVGRLWRPAPPDVVRACDELSADRPDAPGHEVRITEIANAHRTVEALTDNIHEAVAVTSMYVKQRVSPRQFRKDWRQMRRAEGQRRRNAQTAAQVTGGEDRLPRVIHLGADAGRRPAGLDPRLRGGGGAGLPRNKPPPQFPLHVETPPTHDR